jgi:hypothetical protein
MRRPTHLLLVIPLLTGVWAGAQSHRIEPVILPVSSSLPRSLRAALDPRGTRLVDGSGEVECELWWVNTVPTQKGASASDVFYNNLSVGTLLGVTHFAKEGHDFRGQAIKAGYYSMRYGLTPEDGNHMGVSSYRDFVLLSSVSAESEAKQTLPFDELLKLSGQVTGTGHPAVMSLVQVNTTFKTFPVLSQDDANLCILQVKLSGQPAAGGTQQEFPLAIVLLGSSADNEGGS